MLVNAVSAEESSYARISHDPQGEHLVFRVGQSHAESFLFTVGDKMKGQAMKRTGMTRVYLPSQP